MHNAIKGIGNRGINRHNRIIAEKENARKAVSLKIEAVWEGWEPPVPKPWESLVKSTKEEFLKKVKGYGKQNDGSDSECEEDGFIEDEEDSDEDEDMGDWEEMQRTERPRRNPSASGSDMDQDEDVQYTDFDADTPVPRKRLRNETASPINKRRRVEVERDMKPARRITRSTAGSISYKEPSKSDSDSDLEVLKPPFGRLVVGKGMPTSKKRRMDSNSESENDLYTLPEKAPQPARNEPATVDTQEGACVQADNAPEGYPEYPSVSPGGEDTGAITADESSRPSKRAKTNESHATDVLEPVPSITRTLGDIDLGARDSSPVDPEKDEVMRQIRTQDELRAFVAAQEARHRQESSTIDMITGFGAGFRRQAARMAAGPEVIYISD